jgi:antitoxin (DNA-binding transcriptional repressor) of toxin-antitoxin stability system
MMTITIPELETRVQEVMTEVVGEGHVVEIERDGQIVARIVPANVSTSPRPWEALHGKARLLATPEESVLREEDFEVYR